jgi:DNA replication initiation complex subunit (GINS family)
MLAAAIAGGDKIDPDLQPGTAEYWQARAQQWEKRRAPELKALQNQLSEAQAKAQQWDQHAESQKTEQQKLADQLAAAQEDARKAHEERFRLLACAQYDLPPELISHLGGGSEDEINERAEAFAAAINSRAAVLAAAQGQAANGQQQNTTPPGPMRPVESMRPGALPASAAKPQDPNSWVRRQIKR